MAKDLYSILGLSKGASADDIKSAYRKMSKEWHPDKHPSKGSGQASKEAEAKFKEINEAYEVLGNAQKKQQYDQFGTTGNGAGGGGNPFGGFDFSNFQQQQGGMDFGDLFGSFFGGGRQSSTDRTRGQDREIEIAIDFTDTVEGVHKTVTLKKTISCETCSGKGAEPGAKVVTCSECSGTGQVTRTAQSFFGAIRQVQVCTKCAGSGKIPEKPCRTCEGEGRHKGQIDLTIDVPAGIDDGQTLRIMSQGDAGIRGGQAGDLYVHVRVRPDSRFTRDGSDIRTTVEVPVVDAILGGQMNVETVHGPMVLTIPDGTQPGQVFRVKGKGLPVLSSSRVGDHYVTVNIFIPKKIGKEEKKLMEEWRKMRP